MSRSKFTAPVREALITYLRAGNTIETACRMVGVHKSQLYRWLEKGKTARAGTMFRTFYDDVQKAEGEAEVRAMTILQQGMRDDPKWAAWYLERRRPEQWARRAREVQPAGPVVIQLSLSDGAPIRPLPSSIVTVGDGEPDSGSGAA